MNARTLLPLGATLLSLALPGTVTAQQAVKLNLIPTNAMPKLGGYRPQLLKLSDSKPAGIHKTPKGLSNPLYGTLTMGAKEKPTSVYIIVDEPAKGDARLFVDSNSNGDLTDDAPAEWKDRPTPGPDGKTFKMYIGGANVALGKGKSAPPLHLGMYRFDPSDTRRPAELRSSLLYFSDYAREGSMLIDDKPYHVMLSDGLATGDFRGKTDPKGSGVTLLIDVNNNGKFDGRGEAYDAAKPFNIKGTTYEIANMSASGDKFTLKKSSQTVAEILPPPDLRAGVKAIAFEAKTTDGQTIHFPETYKDKIVMLDFWATWCGPCRGEIPHLTAAYEKYHSRGFEVLGISLDQEKADEKLATFTKENKMPWSQVYDGKFWEAAVAQQYGVESIPAAYLVDGNTGMILKSGENLRGDKLDTSIAEELSKKGK